VLKLFPVTENWPLSTPLCSQPVPEGRTGTNWKSSEQKFCFPILMNAVPLYSHSFL
jgi:hypothetical protein